MKTRTLRTYDELVAFHHLIGEQYPDYVERARLAHVYYGVFDVDDESQAWGEGEYLVAGAGIKLDTWDLLQVEDDARVTLEYLIVARERRGEGVGEAFLRFLVDAHADREMRLSISPMDEVERLMRLYGRYGFAEAGMYFTDLRMARAVDEDGEWVDSERLRAIAAGDRLTESVAGIDLADYGYEG